MKKQDQKAACEVPAMPISWGVAKWPPNLYPHSVSKARYLVRTHYEELRACGAVTRIGREVVVLGAGWAAFMARGMDRVKGFDMPLNNAKRESADA